MVVTVTDSSSLSSLLDGTLQLENKAVEALFQKMSELSSLPSLAIRVIEAATDESTDAETLREIIELDPVLATRIIRMANSSFFAVQKEVADLKNAITMLGIKQIRNIAVTVFVAQQFRPSGNKQHTLDRARLWRHAMGVGAVARLLARTCRQGDPEEAYLAGLLHDIGLLVIDQHLSRHVPKILAKTAEGQPLHAAAHEVLSFDPSQLGAFIVWRSRFPKRLISAIEFHHTPDEYIGEEHHLIDLVAVADYITTRHGHGVHEDSQPTVPSEQVFQRLGLDPSHLARIRDEVEEILAAAPSLEAA